METILTALVSDNVGVYAQNEKKKVLFPGQIKAIFFSDSSFGIF